MESMESIVFVGVCIASVAVLLITRRFQYCFSLFLHVCLSLTGVSWAVRSLLEGNTKIFSMLTDVSYLPTLTIDSLSAYFVLLISFGMLTGILYAGGYLKPYRKTMSRLELGIHHLAFIWLHISMLMVTVLRDGTFFLLAWEMMSVSSFILILFEASKKETRLIALNYLIQMHVGFILIMGAMMYVQSLGYAFGFDGLAGYFSKNSVLPLFLVLFAGFGIKAGFVPLHTWLPHAHPAAPSHVSGVMSGVMIKMGIYGLLRVLTYIHAELYVVGLIILGVSTLSGLLGVMNAITQHDIKKLLAYHSIENIGIIGMGIGAGLLGVALNAPALAALAFTGGLLHIFNHSLFKSLLFYGAGSVYQATHTRNVEQLGGLMKSMPKTGMLFLLGSLSICGLPPFNGFISEFLIYMGLFKGLGLDIWYLDLSMLASILGLTLIGGLAVFCFTKVFSITFLGSPRSSKASQAAEVSDDMIFSKILVGVLIVAIGLFPNLFVKWVAEVTALYVPDISPIENALPTLMKVGMAGGLFIVVSLVLLWVRSRQQKQVVVEYGPTWGCGYSGANAAVHQYTATSYANNFTELVGPLVGTTTHYEKIAEEGIFPKARHFETHSYDVFEKTLIDKPAELLLKSTDRHESFQTGKLTHYLIYVFVFLALVFLLTYFQIL